MLDKKNSISRGCKLRLLSQVLILGIAAVKIRAQMSAVPVPSPVAEVSEDFTWWYLSLGVLVAGLIGAVVWMMNGKKSKKQALKDNAKKVEKEKNNWETEPLDAGKEMEWLRKNPKLAGKSGKKKVNKNLHPTNNLNTESAIAAKDSKTEAAELPIFSIKRIELARPVAPLPLSNDAALMSAIEQTHDEFEEDEEVRDLALRILTAFRTRNSVEALSQMALYDLSSNLRSKAVAILSEFNHESVFESILQASADPTREVRAAAARALSQLSIDRADAWSRIFESEAEGRMRQAARAAVESGFVEMSFERLVHGDVRYAYEAVALMVLLIKAGETEEIFRALENHKNKNVRRAILHVIRITKSQNAIDELSLLLDKKTLPLELQEEVDKTIEEIGFVSV